MTYEQIISDLKNKIYKPIYFLMGEETYFIDQITDYIADKVLTEAEKGFNLSILYGKDTDITTIIHTAKRFPMMANYQVVIVKEAQNIKDIEELVHYVQAPLKSTLLVINYKYKTLDKRKKLHALLAKNAVVLESKRLYEDKIPDWITQYLSQKGFTIAPNASRLLTEYLGTDLGKISNELNKLMITLGDEKKITTAHIEQNIGISKDYNVFEYQKALVQKDVLKANRIVEYFNRNPKDNPMPVILASLYSFVIKVLIYHTLKDKSRPSAAVALKVPPFFVSDYEQAAKRYPAAKLVYIISQMRDYDMKSKGFGNTSASHGDLLRELTYKILH